MTKSTTARRFGLRTATALALAAGVLASGGTARAAERAPLTADALNQLAEQYLESGTTVSAEDAAHARAALVSTWVRGLQAQGTPPALWRRVGCAQCDGTGYKGRMGIHELMCSDDAIRGHIRRRESAHDIRRSALRAGMKTLRQDGIDKVLQGLTDIQEVLAASNQ